MSREKLHIRKNSSLPLIGDRIREVRKDQNLNQKSFSKKHNISFPALVNYETNKRLPPVDFLTRLILAYQVSAYWLHTGEGEKYWRGSHIATFDEMEKIKEGLSMVSEGRREGRIPDLIYMAQTILESGDDQRKITLAETIKLLYRDMGKRVAREAAPAPPQKAAQEGKT